MRKSRSFEIIKRKAPFNYSLNVLSDLLDGYMYKYKDIPPIILARLEKLKHDIDFIYNSDPIWLQNYDIEDFSHEIVYSLRKYI